MFIAIKCKNRRKQINPVCLQYDFLESPPQPLKQANESIKEQLCDP